MCRPSLCRWAGGWDMEEDGFNVDGERAGAAGAVGLGRAPGAWQRMAVRAGPQDRRPREAAVRRRAIARHGRRGAAWWGQDWRQGMCIGARVRSSEGEAERGKR